jgi:hypothetical protein
MANPKRNQRPTHGESHESAWKNGRFRKSSIHDKLFSGFGCFFRKFDYFTHRFPAMGQ